MARRKKNRLEPDYRRKGYREIKAYSKAAFARANAINAFVALIMFCSLGLVWFAVTNPSVTDWRSLSPANFFKQIDPNLSNTLLGITIILAITFLLISSTVYRRTRRIVDDRAKELIAKPIVEKPPESQPLPSPIHALDQDFDLAVVKTPPTHLKPTDFEHQVAWLFGKLYTKHGQPLRTEVVGGAGDGGIDIKIWDQQGLLTAIVQCKRYQVGKVLPPSYVRDLAFVRNSLGVHRAYLVTTASFSTDTRQLAKQNNIDLIDGEQLVTLFNKAGGLFNPNQPDQPAGTFTRSQFDDEL